MKTEKRITYASSMITSFVLAFALMGIGANRLAGAEAMYGTEAGSASQSASLTGDAESGEQLWFTYYCYSCHGTAGNGGAAPRVSNSPRTMENFIQYVRNPARMPPYVNRVMSDQQLADVYEFMQVLPGSPSVSDIPMLQELLDSR